MSRGMWQRAATAVAVIGILLTAAATLVFGTYDITLDRVWQTLTGGGSPMDRQIILEQRLPRLLAALVVGAGEPGEPEGGPLDGDGRVAAGKVDDGFTDGPGESAGPRDDGGIQLDQRRSCGRHEVHRRGSAMIRAATR